MSEEIPIWRVKYLPKNLGEICGREKTIERLQAMIKQGNFPHLLLVGSEGIGKTTIARLFSKAFLGRDYVANFKLVYADVPLTEEERKEAKSGVYVSKSKLGSIAGRRITTPAFIKVKVKPFVQLKVLGEVPFKILIVKNFEALGSNQQGFRRLMEIYGNNCRMILITTKVSGIIDPIISRCQLFLMSQASMDSFKNLISVIAALESLQIEDGVIEALYRISEGKLFKAIDLLQLSSISSKTIKLETLYENSQAFQKKLISELVQECFTGDFQKARELSRTIQTTYKFNSHDIFAHLLVEFSRLPLSRFSRMRLINMVADADFRALDGRDNDIQISALLSKICNFSKLL